MDEITHHLMNRMPSAQQKGPPELMPAEAEPADEPMQETEQREETNEAATPRDEGATDDTAATTTHGEGTHAAKEQSLVPMTANQASAAAEPDTAWRCDKKGHALSPEALYMRFYRSIRSTLSCVGRIFRPLLVTTKCTCF